MQLGLIGLGTMGGGMLARLREAGHGVVGCDITANARAAAAALGAIAVASAGELAGALPSPRVVLLMLPTGDTTGIMLRELGGLLSAGDIVADGGNSDFRAAAAHADIRYWNEPARGGHFAAFEQPDLFVNEVRSFFRLVR